MYCNTCGCGSWSCRSRKDAGLQETESSPSGKPQNPDRLPTRVSHTTMSHRMLVSWILTDHVAKLRRVPSPLAWSRARNSESLTIPSHRIVHQYSQSTRLRQMYEDYFPTPANPSSVESILSQLCSMVWVYATNFQTNFPSLLPNARAYRWGERKKARKQADSTISFT